MDILQVLVPIAYAGIILLATWIIARSITLLIRKLMGQSTQLFGSQVQKLVWLLVWLVGLILAVQQLGVNPDILLLMVGLMGIAVIVALRGPLENFGARYFTHGYIPFKIGDSITIQNHSGKIIEINAMSTILLSHDHIISIPNNTFVKEAVLNTTHQAWKTVTVSIVVDNDINLPAFESSVLKSVNKLRPHFDDRFPPIISVVARNRQTMELLLTVMIRFPDKRGDIINEVNKRVAELVDEAKKSTKHKKH